MIGPPPRPYSPPAAGAPGPTDAKAKVPIRQTTWPSSPFRLGSATSNPTSTSSSAGSTISAPSGWRPRPSSSPCRRQARQRGPTDRRDRAAASAPERPVVQVRHPRQRAAELEVRLTVKDALEVDNRASPSSATPARRRSWRSPPATATCSTIRHPRRPAITPTSDRHSRGGQEEELSREIGRQVDLVVYDGVRLKLHGGEWVYLVIASGPSLRESQGGRAAGDPGLEHSHPLMQYIRDLSLVFVAKASLVELPAGRPR